MALEDLLAALRDPPEPLLALRRVPGLRLVGGWLRQAYYGERGYDLDLTCELPLADAVSACAAVLGAEPFALNERYPTRRLLAGEYTLDISQLTDGSVAADIARRDYTCNTLMVALDRLGPHLARADIEGHELALADIHSRTLRMVSAASLEGDPLRVLRGYRFCATEGYTPEPLTREAWRQLAGRLRDSAAERIHEELLRWFSGGAAIPGGADILVRHRSQAGMPAPPGRNTRPTGVTLPDTLAMCADDGVLWAVFPTLREMPGCIQGEGVDVWQHTLDCLRHLDALRAELPPELVPYAEHLAVAWDEPVSGAATAGTLTRLALLLHDSAKPATRAVDAEGKHSFHDHQNIGADLLLPELQALKFAGAEVDYILLLVREHLRLGFYTNDPPPLPPRLVYRYIRRLGRATPLMLLHSIADCMATRGDWTVPALRDHITAARQILEHYYALDSVAQPPLLLNGDEIMEVLKLAPGRIVGELKDALLEATASGEVLTREEAIGFVRREYKQRRAAEAGLQ